MKQSTYIHFHTTELLPEDRLTKEDAQLAWIRDINPQNPNTEKDFSFDFQPVFVLISFPSLCPLGRSLLEIAEANIVSTHTSHIFAGAD